MHSPHVFKLITQVFNDRSAYPEYEQVAALRTSLLHDRRMVPIIELGAGSSMPAGAGRRVSDMARHAAKSPKLGKLLFRLCRFYQPAQIIELGTSLGISSHYLQLGNPAAQVHTIEGSPAVAAIARENFERSRLGIDLITGNFDDALPSLLTTIPSVDLAFIDGNHRQEPTMRYFEQLLPHTGPDSVLVFDDIHWSPGMERAWDSIRMHASVRCSIDLFHIGIVLFRKEFLEKVDFRIRF